MKHATFEKWDAFTVAEVFNMKEDELPEFIGDDGHFSTQRPHPTQEYMPSLFAGK